MASGYLYGTRILKYLLTWQVNNGYNTKNKKPTNTVGKKELVMGFYFEKLVRENFRFGRM